MRLNLDMTLEQVAEVPQTAGIFNKYLPGKLAGLVTNDKTKHLSIRQIIGYSQGMIPQSVQDGIERDLAALGVDSIATESEKKKIAYYKSLKPAGSEENPVKRDCFCPGRKWTDTEGKRIHAHGGGILYEDGVYYWFGENKEHTKGENDIWTWGIRLYRSQDLYNWEDMGLIIEPVLDDPENILFPDIRMDRPHILHNPKTGKYVCWIHLAGRDSGFLIMEADQLTGPYEMVEQCCKPGGWNVGDFDIVTAQDGRAYLYLDVNHSFVAGMELAEDYRSAKTEVSRQYENLRPPFCREGFALFERRGTKYMLSSGMTGYLPNRSDAAVSDGWDKPFTSVGNPYPEDDSNSSFNSQLTDVFRVPGKKDLYIAMSDRWVPYYPIDAHLADVMERAIAFRYDPSIKVTDEELDLFNKAPDLHTANTSLADYVWLPISFEEGKPVIHWRDQWSLDEFEEE